MIINKINDDDLQSFKITNEIVVDKNVIGEFIKDTAELVILNRKHQYDILDKDYIDINKFGEWYVEEIENNEEEESLTLKLCDKSQKFDEDYEDSFPFPATMKEWGTWIGNKVGIPLKGSFLNENLILTAKPYLGNNPKWRNAIRVIAKYASGWADMNADGTYSIKWFEEKIHIIDDWETFKHGIKTKPTNILILSTGVTEDNVRFPETIPDEPHELRIEDDWTNINRYEINEAIYNQINGFFYTPISDLTLMYGIFDLKPGQKIKTKDIELNDIETYISSHTLTWDGGSWEDENSWTSSVQMSDLQETTTKYQYSNSIENRLGKAEINVDKNNKKIEMIAEDIGEVQRTMTTKKSQKGNPIEIDDAGEYPLKKAIIYGKSYQDLSERKVKVVTGKEITSTETDEDEKKNKEYTSNYLSLYTRKRNIFNKNDYTAVFGHIYTDSYLKSNSGNYCLIIPVEPNTTYTIQKNSSTRFILGTTSNELQLLDYNKINNVWKISESVLLENVAGSQIDNSTIKTYTTNSNAKYLIFEFWVNNESVSKQDILDSIMIEKRTLKSEYQEYEKREILYDLKGEFLGQVGNILDELDCNNNIIYKNIGKIVINGSEGITKRNDGDGNTTISFNIPISGNAKIQSITCDRFMYEQNSQSGNEGIGAAQLGDVYIQILRSKLTTVDVSGFKSWLQENPLTIYYILEEPYTVQLDAQEPLELFPGYNYITCNDSLMPEIEIDYLTDSEFNTQYASKSELDITNEKVSIITESQEDITELVNNNAIDINNKFSDLNSTLNEELANNADAIVNLNKTVEQLQTNSEIVFEFKNSIEVNGVNKIETSNSYTFNENGLKIKDSESNIGSELDNKGLLIEDTSGAESEELLYAGIDDATNEAVVRSKNISVSQYFIMGSNSRFEDFIDEDGEEGTGVFFVGEESDT